MAVFSCIKNRKKKKKGCLYLVISCKARCVFFLVYQANTVIYPKEKIVHIVDIVDVRHVWSCFCVPFVQVMLSERLSEVIL